VGVTTSSLIRVIREIRGKNPPFPFFPSASQIPQPQAKKRGGSTTDDTDEHGWGTESQNFPVGDTTSSLIRVIREIRGKI
jgi:hypothetical protein